MINPTHKLQWRPEKDLGRRYTLQVPLEVYVPKNAADAVAYLTELALPELVAYDGYAGQPGLIREAAAERWSYLFPEVVITEPIVRPSLEAADYVGV